MKIRASCFCLSFCIALSAVAQQPAPVPRVTYFSGVVKDAAGAPQTGVAGIAFALYEEQQGGAALWTEIQNVPLDDQGRYTALLGSMQPDGLPQDLFSSGKARWLGVTPQLPDAAEQPRILLVGVPYALKAADADTLGGMPASAFLKAAGGAPATGGSATKADDLAADSPNTACAKITGTGTATANQIALFTAACKVGPASALYESGAYVGIGNQNPVSPLDVTGMANFRNGLTVTGNVAATGGAVNVSGAINADIGNTNNGALTPGIQFGSPTGEGMASKRTVGGNQYGLDFYTDFTPRLSVMNGGNVGVGTTAPAATLEVNGNAQVDGNLTLGLGGTINMPANSSGNCVAPACPGGPVLQAPNDGNGNLSVGLGAWNPTLNLDYYTSNTAVGANALHSTTTGIVNTAIGGSALMDNTTGVANTAIGAETLELNTAGGANTAVGSETLDINTTGAYNVAIGSSALGNNTTGDSNIAIGYNAGLGLSHSGSNNIEIGNLGTSSDNATIRIGTPGTHTSAFMAGIRGVTTGNNNAVPVLIDSNGQLGTVSSSRRYKEDIHDMGDASGGLLRLRPVTFRYKQPFNDGSKPIQYGLIAEEVAEVYPDLVVRSAGGQIETVKYQDLTPMLLNELQKQRDRIRSLEARLAAMEAALEGRQ